MRGEWAWFIAVKNGRGLLLSIQFSRRCEKRWIKMQFTKILKVSEKLSAKTSITNERNQFNEILQVLQGETVLLMNHYVPYNQDVQEIMIK
jgi:hypothetical protein